MLEYWIGFIEILKIKHMYLFDKDEALVKYESANAIIDDFVETRLMYYGKRKAKQIEDMERMLVLYSNKYTFIMELLNDTLDLRKKKSNEIETILTEKDYDKIENSYHYLVKMPMDMVNEENVNKLKGSNPNKPLIHLMNSLKMVEIYLKQKRYKKKKHQ